MTVGSASPPPSTPASSSKSVPAGQQQYHRSVSGRSVSDVIKQYEARSSSQSQSMSDFAPDQNSPSRMIRRPSGIPSRSNGPGGQSPSSMRQENGQMSREASQEYGAVGNGAEAGPSRVRPRAIGLGAPIGLRTKSDVPTTPPPRTKQSRPSTASSIPRPFPQSISMPRNLSASAAAHAHRSPPGSAASRPTSTNTSLPRSISDNFSSFSSATSSKPSSEAGPSRLPSPTKRGHPVVAISVSRPTPDKRNPPLRRRSSRADPVQPALRSPISPTSPGTSGIPLPSNPRRPSYRSTSSSISSQGSAPSNYYSPGSFSPQQSPFNLPSSLGPEMHPTRNTSMPMDRGVNSRSRDSRNRVVELASPTASPSGGSPRGSPISSSRGSPRLQPRSSPRKDSQQSIHNHVEIPRRISSTSQPSSPTSGSLMLQGAPTISPRRSSMKNALQQGPPSPTKMPTKGSDLLSEASRRDERNRSSSRPSLHSRASSSSSTSRMTSRANHTISASSRQPSSPDSSRRSSFLSRPISATSPSNSRHSSFQSPSRESLSRNGPGASPRKSPGLTINPPPPLLSHLSSSASQPSPPVPAKSPLRGLSRNSSGSGSPMGETRTPRSGSGESTTANAGTPTSAIERVKRMSDVGNGPGRETPIFKTPFDGEGPPSTAGGPPTQKIETPADEIRFTTLTVPSMYSQDSAPPSATSWALGEATARSGDSWISDDSSQGGPRRLDSVSWGQKRGSQGSQVVEDIDNSRHSFALSRLTMPLAADKVLPNLPSETPTTATTNDSSVVSHNATSGHTPVSPVAETRREPVKSPSLPVMRPDSRALRERSKTSNGPLLPPATLREEDGANSLRPLLPNSPSMIMSKRSHLIREIAVTERAYAKDLALIRDAYMYRFLRPASDHSTHTNGDSSVSPGNISDASRRSSVYTYQTAETKRSSGYESLGSSWIVPHQNISSPLPTSPSDGIDQNGSSGYFSSTAQASTTSLHVTPQPSPRKGSRSSVTIPPMPPPVGKPLAPADLKTVFLNLDQLAGVADELATAFEQALGEGEVGPGASVRENEVGTDRLGQIFTSMIPRLRPMYIFYCSRQSQASVRLTQLQAEPQHAAYLSDCWNQVKSRTHAWNLDSMLIKPVQRITKYPLLFDDLLANTTPVHPDYFAIRTSAQMSKSVAMEIDDAKRRQDVVSNAIGTKKSIPVAVSKNDKQPAGPKLLGLKRFRNKDKVAASTISLTKSVSSMDLGAPANISDSSLMQLKDLVNKVDELDHAVKSIGKEIVFWTAAAKEVFVAEDGLAKVWLKVVQLDPTDLADRRLLEFRRVIDTIIGEAWTALHEEVKETIMPVFSKLLESSTNPRKVIVKRDAKLIDYGRYQALRSTKKTPDRIIIQNANEFVALHTQLLEELPAFLEGYLRILDIALVAFSKAQAKYHSTVKDRLAQFTITWMEPPSTPDLSSIDSPGAGGQTSARRIVKIWHEAWAPYVEAMEHFQCTRPVARNAIPRVATFNRPMSANRPVSRAGGNAGSPMGPPLLRHSASTASQISLSDLARAGSPHTTRIRSSSLRSQTAPTINLTAPPSPSLDKGSSSRFSLLRRSNSKNQVSREKDSIARPTRPPLSPRESSGRLRPLSVGMTVTASEESTRHSWGLPKISQDQNRIFEGIGLSPTKSQTSVLSSTSLLHQQMRATSDPTPSPRLNGDSSRHPFAAQRNPSQVSMVSTATSTGTGLGFGDLGGVEAAIAIDANELVPLPDTSPVIPQVPQSPQISRTNGHETSNGNGYAPRRNRGLNVDAAAGWRNEKVLYQCACVADFEPSTFGNKRYRGLRFLSMVSGDLIDVFHEVGRIDELPAFPYPEVGVDNDGVLVGRAEDGQIGLVICSFLEPLRD